MKPETPRQWIFFCLGWLFLALGVAGIFLPLLPTTSFLLLSAACFARSSDRFYHWLMNHPVFGAAIRNYREHHAVTLQTKVVSLVTLWVTIGATAGLLVSAWWLRMLLLAVAAGVTIHLLSLKTMKIEPGRDGEESLPAAD